MCQACGLCCNGVIFADVSLQPGEDAEVLRSLGLRLKPSQARADGAYVPKKFLQPCLAFEGCRCRIYAERPQHCRNFECLLLKSLLAGQTDRVQAFKLVQRAHERADKVRGLLGRLGDTDESQPLARRFRRMAKRLEDGGLDRATTELYGQLTLAVHELNLLLSRTFYPGATPS